ncbi:MAG TPA: FAD binding domain-containing protein [Thermoanaerobaculia bacterium]|nr:FAD binding domain-containing protein [Thermoanaerobaculia bacterium]
MLRLPAFDFHRARTLPEAAAILAGEGAAEGQLVRLVAGGTDLWPNMKRRHQKAQAVVSLMGIPGLSGIDVNGEIHIGATTLLDDVARHPAIRERYPAFAAAVQSISSPPLRNMGTIGGNLCVDTRCTYYNQTEDWRRAIDYCMKEEGEICWVATSSPRCWAHTASDSAPMAIALGARVKLVSKDGERVIPVEDLYKEDGIHYLAKRPDEILTGLYLPAGSDATRCRSAFWKLRRRGSIDFAVLSVAAAIWTDPAGAVTQARIYLGAVASAPVPALEAASFLIGKTLTEETVTHAAKLARKIATPMDNTDFQTQWRGVMVQRYTEAALREVAGLPPGRLAPKHGMPVLPVVG